MEITRLIERCRQGDADALGELYKAYAQRMRGVCRRYISDEQTVEDVLHDAFVIIFTSFDRLRDDRWAEPWMKAITRNVALKCKDHLEALPMVSLEETSEMGLIAAEDEERDVRGVPSSEVVRMIDRLPEGYGQVFRLSVFEGMTHKEIADRATFVIITTGTGKEDAAQDDATVLGGWASVATCSCYVLFAQERR